MKKLISLVALFVVTAAFVGCGPDKATTKATVVSSTTKATGG